MSSDPQSNWKKKLEEIEVDIGNIGNSTPSIQVIMNNMIATVSTWFNGLPVIGKAIVGLFGISVFFSVLKAVFSLLQLMFSLTILGLIGYVAYQFLLKGKSESESQ